MTVQVHATTKASSDDAKAPVAAGHPHPGQQYTHGWKPLSELVDSLKAAGGEEDGGLSFPDGRYIDWSGTTADVVHPDEEARILEIGDKGGSAQIVMSGHEERSLFHALTLTVMADEGGPHSHHVAAMGMAGHDHLLFADGGVADWSTKNPDGTRTLDVTSDSGDNVAIHLAPDELRKWQASMGLVQLKDQASTVHAAAGHDVTPGHDELHHYWTIGEGRHLWVDSPTPWTTLVAELVKATKGKVPLTTIHNWASRWFIEVKGYAAGSDKNRVAHGHPPRGHVVGPG